MSNRLIEYSEIPSLPTGTIVTYQEYQMDRHEKLHFYKGYENMPIEGIIPAGMALNRETLEIYLGNDLDDMDYLIQCVTNTHRLVLKHTDEYQRVQYILLNFNPYFMATKQQQLIAVGELVNKPIPNYNKVLGFNDYDFGGLRNEEENSSR